MPVPRCTVSAPTFTPLLSGATSTLGGDVPAIASGLGVVEGNVVRAVVVDVVVATVLQAADGLVGVVGALVIGDVVARAQAAATWMVSLAVLTLPTDGSKLTGSLVRRPRSRA